IVDPARAADRTSTFAFTWEGKTPAEVADHLARANISTGAGNFYGLGVLDTLGLSTAVRAGCVHYNTVDEMDRLFKALQTL
ncbi:MAG: aminotransferase class V-fold PLP-dependent enzyme, partial [Alphaproteobacteria bacterium]|nr:aminotransferase class V-fold PLP-dependent enzyme [Alphaproteobacteria bacterium]